MNNKQKFLNDVVVVDTETTELDSKTAEIVELAVGSYDNGNFDTATELFRSRNPISFKASAISNITDKHVAGKPTITEEWSTRVSEMLQFNDKSFVVAHNAKFDSAMLETAYVTSLDELGDEAVIPRFRDVKWLCTYRLARHIFNDFEDIGFKLNELRYYFDLDVSDELVMHRADADVIVAGKLLEYIIDVAIDKNIIDENNIGDDLYKLCWSIIPISTMTFGKYKDKLISDMPASYLLWLVDNHDSMDETSDRYDNDFAEAIKNEMESRLE